MGAKTIMVQGTGSYVGKTTLVTALCRIFKQDGYQVAPFKAQNMSLNSFVTRDGGEVARAQATQAEAAGVPVAREMNPILLKPMNELGAQIIVNGEVYSNMDGEEYRLHKDEFFQVVKRALSKLISKYEIVVIEGAGSPAEVNLREWEIANMRVAELFDTPILLLSDIDRGGCFAWIVGTLELLSPLEVERVKGVVINKFRGDLKLLKPGITYLEAKIGKPVLGVIPYFKDIRIAGEDSQALDEEQEMEVGGKGKISVVVIRLPHISNYTDFQCFESEKEVTLQYLKEGEEIESPDLLILPGTKSTISDLLYLKKSGLIQQIKEAYKAGTMIIGICGGYQMLGRRIEDPYGVEGVERSAEGIGLLNTITVFELHKSTYQVKAKALSIPFGRECEVKGYEIHMGKTSLLSDVTPAFEIVERVGRDKIFGMEAKDGAVSKDGLVFGTYIHGIFENDDFRSELIKFLRRRKRRGGEGIHVFVDREKEFDKLALLVRENLRLKEVYRIMGIGG
jgi:adenosylcobyric acid synthase